MILGGRRGEEVEKNASEREREIVSRYQSIEKMPIISESNQPR
jgi:hypothetical protein